MKTKLGASLIAALMMMGLFGAASATADPGPNGKNEKGLCTAYFNGQKNGHNKDGKASPGPFAALEDTAEDDGSNEEESTPGETAIESDVFEFCDEFGIMGQPEHNGRFDCREESGAPRDTDDSDGDGQTGDGEIECLANTNEGETGGDHPSGKDK
jgi:hypothetical protein